MSEQKKRKNFAISIMENGIVHVDITAEMHWHRLVTIAFAVIGILAALANLPQVLNVIPQILNWVQ